MDEASVNREVSRRGERSGEFRARLMIALTSCSSSCLSRENVDGTSVR